MPLIPFLGIGGALLGGAQLLRKRSKTQPTEADAADSSAAAAAQRAIANGRGVRNRH
jgi:hypothetical protein